MTHGLNIRISPDFFEKRAAQFNQKITTIPMKDETIVKILSNDTSFDTFQVSGNKIVGMCGAHGKNAVNDSKHLIAWIQERAIDGINVLKEFTKSLGK